jgi:hypothetical protein
MSFSRWLLACVLGCVILRVVLLPPSDYTDPFYRWNPERSLDAGGLVLRDQAAWRHGAKLWTAYQSARVSEIAQRELGAKSSHVPAGAISVWFDSDVPNAVRAAVNHRIAAEDSARGSWRGRGHIGVLVVTDTMTKIDGLLVPLGYNAGLAVSTSVLPVSRDSGDRCVSVVRIGHAVLAGIVPFPADRSLLDACAFYDAFGAPGNQIAAWLGDERFAYARVLSLAPPDSAALRAARWGYEDFQFADDYYTRCAGGDESACLATLHAKVEGIQWYYWSDRSVPEPRDAQQITQPARGFRGTLLDAMVRDIGPDRFLRVWQSPRPIDEAFLDATGEPLAAWVHRRAVAISGPYHIGPLPTPTSAILTLVTLAILVALTQRFARRPGAV